MKYIVNLLRIPLKGGEFELPKGAIILQGLDDRVAPTEYMRIRIAVPVEEPPTK
jgi:hypothetical protein